jgi:hypothetical protein
MYLPMISTDGTDQINALYLDLLTDLISYQCCQCSINGENCFFWAGLLRDSEISVIGTSPALESQKKSANLKRNEVDDAPLWLAASS